MSDPKYTIREIERRWLVDPNRLPELAELDAIKIEDLYIADTRLRLRKMTFNKGGETQYKFCKKYGKTSDMAEPIVNIYLTAAEYQVLNRLKGQRLERIRYHYPYEGTVFRINVIPSGGPIIAEAEFETEALARACRPPAYCLQEVTASLEFEAHSLV